MLNCLILEHVLYFINSTLFTFQKHILILVIPPDDETFEISGYNLVSLHLLKKLPTLTSYQRQLFIRMYKFRNNDLK